jgi:acyl-CoA synthetase (AMP-forming)/AMP-acid ligase II
MGMGPGLGLAERIGAVAALDPAAPVLEFGGRWRTWGELGATIERVASLVPAPGTEVGILLRNRPASIGLLLGVLRAGGCVVTVNPGRGDDRTRSDLAALDLPFVAGEPDDLDRFATGPGLHATRIAADDLGSGLWTSRWSETSRARNEVGDRGVAVRMLTSGTTGPPKRVDLPYRMLERVLAGAKHYESDRAGELRLRNGVAIVNSPLVHLGGLFRVLQCISDGRSFALLERFTVEGWVDAVRRHRPATASLVPAALRMVLEADVDPADLASLRSVVSGTAPLSPDDADAFTARFGVPVLVSYAATEFGGGVAGWNLADHQAFWSSKRGSVGRAHPGCELRVVDAGSDPGGVPGSEPAAVLGPDEEGLLEVKAAQLGDDAGWVRTTDLARIDADGFVWILGRADQAIIRGGFKVRPEDVRTALERHPRVRGAAVVGRPDARLGAVPVAAVELRPGSDTPPTPQHLLDHLATQLARYELPAEIRIVDELPRTPAGKPDLAGVGALFDEPRPPPQRRQRWTFGVEPLPQTVTLAGLLRRVTDLAVSLEGEDDEVDRLIGELRTAEARLSARVPADPRPRIGSTASDGRVYVDHARHVGAFNACFPEYAISVDGDRASGTVTFPLAFEGPPGIVHGGFLGVFFDQVIQHHNCDVGVAGKTTSLALRYRRPVPLLADLRFTLARSVDDRRITSTGALAAADGTVLCEAEMQAVAGDLSALPAVSPRRPRS